MTIGVLADYMNTTGSAYESQLRDAIDTRCRELDYNLVFVYGRALAEPNPRSASHNAIFELIDSETCDGLLLLSSCLAAHSGKLRLERLVQRYHRLPLCSIGVLVAGVPSVVLDNRAGMESVTDHMILAHGCRRIAFVGGTVTNPEAEVRLEAYRAVLARHGIELDPALIVCGNFTKECARAAVEQLIHRKIEMDALIAANDAMAAGAMEALRNSGRRTPRDIPVAGFDDVQFARLGNPPLTTVRQPFEAMARLGLDIVLDQIAGRSVPPIAEVRPEFVVRRSCGCNAPPPRARPKTGPIASVSPADYLCIHAEQIRLALAACMPVGLGAARSAAERLVAALRLELDGHTDSFLLEVEDLVEEAGEDSECGHALQLALSALRKELAPVASLDLESLWCEAAMAVALGVTASRALHGLTVDELYFQLVGANERASATLDLPSLESVLLKSLPERGIRTAFISRFTERDPDELEPFVCLLNGAHLVLPSARFPAHYLLPPGVCPAQERRTFLVLPLVFESQWLGIAAFEYSTKVSGYNIIRDQISDALHNLALHHEIVQKTKLHERSVQERLATAKRIQSLSVLAGGVAHDLNNALGPLVALPDIILDELAALPVDNPAMSELRADVASIKTASLRAAQTIKDLLTLGRQGRAARAPLDLNRVVQGCLAMDHLQLLGTEERQAELVIQLAQEPLTIGGSEMHLGRALVNLVRNALEATSEQGRVVVRTSRSRVIEPLQGFELIEPGEYAVLSVVDDGCGIAAAEVGRIFEPFFSTKRLSNHSGTGLGLAIVHGVTKEHQGFVDVVSTPGKGTTFILYFPLLDGSGTSYGAKPTGGHKPARILLVDDESIQLRTGRRVLSRLGYHVDTLNSGQRTCELFAEAAPSGKSPYDLVILDMLLDGEQDGLEVFEYIHRLFPEQKVVLASGHAPPDRIKTAARSGLAWLTKPYTAESLTQTVLTTLEPKVVGNTLPPRLANASGP